MNTLNAARVLLQRITELYPPGDGMRHNLTMNGDKLELNLMFNGVFQPVLIAGNELGESVELVIDQICFLIDPIRERLLSGNYSDCG